MPGAFSAVGKISVDYLKGRVAVVKMSNPKVNQLDLPFLKELHQTITTLEEKDEVEGIVLTSAVPRVFSGGLDLNELATTDEKAAVRYFTAFQDTFKKLFTSSLFTVAAVNGAAPAGGTVIAMGCDYRIGTNNPKYVMGLREAAIGIVPPTWLQSLAARTLGQRNAELDLQLGSMFAPVEAHARGYLDQITSEEAMLEAAIAAVDRALKTPKQARVAVKRMQRRAVAESMGPGCAEEFWETVRQPVVQEEVKRMLQALQKGR